MKNTWNFDSHFFFFTERRAFPVIGLQLIHFVSDCFYGYKKQKQMGLGRIVNTWNCEKKSRAQVCLA